MHRPKYRIALLTPWIAALALGGLWWLASTGAHNESGPGAGPEPGAGSQADPSQTTRAPRTGTAALTSQSRVPATSADSRARFDLEGAHWVEGRVLIPAGSPEDESLAVEAHAAQALDPTALLNASSVATLESAANVETEALCSARVEADGSFRLPLPPTWTAATLMLKGRFLYAQPLLLRNSQEAQTPILDAQLGAWVRARFKLPPQTPDDQIPQVGCLVRLVRPMAVSSASRGNGGAAALGVSWGLRTLRSGAIDSELRFEWRAVPADELLELHFRSGVLAPLTVSDLRFSPGETRRAEWSLQLGARIDGLVVDEAGQSVPAAKVHLQSAHSGFGTPAATQICDELGNFSLLGLVAGSYSLTASHPHYLPSQPKPVELHDTQQLSQVALHLERGLSISGRILWPAGEPAPGAEVRLTPLASVSALGRGLQADLSTADETGRFLFRGLPDMEFQVTCQAAAAAVSTAWGQEGNWSATTRSKAGALDLDLVLSAPNSARGLVVDDLGRPIPKFEILAAPIYGQNAGAATSLRDARNDSFENPEGEFEVLGLGPGAWSLSATAVGCSSANGAIRIEFPGENPPLKFQLNRLGSITGRVLAPDGSTVTNADIEAVPLELASTADRWLNTIQTTSGSKGLYRIENIQSGQVRLTARGGGWAACDSVILHVEPGTQTQVLDLRLKHGAEIAGEVRSGAGVGIEGANVSIAKLEPEDWDTTLDPIQTDSDGYFRQTQLDAGAYEVTVSASLLPPSLQTQTQSTSVEAGEARQLSFELAAGAAIRIHGKITRGGRPASNVLVSIGPESVGQSQSAFNAGADGTYTLTVDQPGLVQILAASYDARGTQAGGHLGVASFATVVPDVREFQWDLDLPASAIAGRALDSERNPLAGIEISLEALNSFEMVDAFESSGAVATDSKGEFRFSQLAAGNYQLRAEPGTIFGGGHDAGLGAIRSPMLTLDEGRELSDIELILPESGSIVGQVLGPGGLPAAGARIACFDGRGRRVYANELEPTGPNGNFKCRGLAPGEYELVAMLGPLCSAPSAPISVRTGGESRAQLALAQAGEVLIRCSGPGGEPMAARATIIDSRGRDWSLPAYFEGSAKFFAAQKSGAGNWIGPLPASLYRVRARALDGTGAELEFEIKAGERLQLELKLR